MKNRKMTFSNFWDERNYVNENNYVNSGFKVFAVVNLLSYMVIVVIYLVNGCYLKFEVVNMYMQ